ncbi:hypothetical protein CISIN_1g0419861mg, partial [Citrus sinensis]
MGLKQSSQIH